MAIFGAGPVTGLSLARRFGREGFRIALVSRTKRTQDEVAAALAADGIEATGFTADVYDRTDIAAAVDAITAAYGRIDVVEFSPGGGTMGEDIVPISGVTPENARSAFDRFTLSAVALVDAVLPAMVERGHGTILFTAGQSGLHPVRFLGNAGMAQAALRNYYLNLNALLAPDGVHVGAVNVGMLIEGSVPHQVLAADPSFAVETVHPDVLAEHFWQLHHRRGQAEVLVGDLGRVAAEFG
ncbi:SDR family NAD(P)-dependent oxidoreductase [Saccharothrix violaceirubra]